MDYYYYPGCSLKGTAKDYNKSIETVSEKLNINLIELPEWTCCGASPAHISQEKLNLAIPALTLAEADKHELNLITACAACYNRLRSTRAFLEKNNEKKKEIEELIGKPLTGQSNIKHFLETIMNDLKIDWQSLIKKPLKGLKVACYYGCLLTRPNYMLDKDLFENPQIMDKLMEILGAEPINWSYKTECCGTSFGVSKPEVVVKLSGKILKSAFNNKVDCLVTACPLCQANLDLRQGEIEKKYNEKFDLPIFYFPELISIAFGDYKNLNLDMHIVNPFPLLSKKGFV